MALQSHKNEDGEDIVLVRVSGGNSQKKRCKVINLRIQNLKNPPTHISEDTSVALTKYGRL